MPSISEAVSCPGSSARSATHTRAPASAKRRAVSRPIPPAPPVTTATFLSRRPGISVLLRALRPRLGRVLLTLGRDVDVLYLGVIVEGVRSEFAPDARLLHPPERGRDPDGGVRIYRDHARLHAPRHAQGAGTVLGPDRTR